ncbi:hypothetical protein ACWEP4_45595, partial [Streptomyces sp. NPDC004227]
PYADPPSNEPLPLGRPPHHPTPQVIHLPDGLMRKSREMWASLPVLMEAIATSLETNQPLNDYTPVVDEEQRLYWDFISLRSDRTLHRS